MITNITETTFDLDGETVDLVWLESQKQLMGSADTIHIFMNNFCILQNIHRLAHNGKLESSEKEERLIESARNRYRQMIQKINEKNTARYYTGVYHDQCISE